MTGLNLAALLIAAFAGGAYLALVVRAFTAERAHQRISDAAEAALSPDALERLREYIAAIDENARGAAERPAMTLERDSGSTVVYYPSVPPR